MNKTLTAKFQMFDYCCLSQYSLRFKSMKKNILLFLLFGMSIGHAQWVQKKGTGYYKAGFWWLEANAHFTNVGLVDPNATRGLFISSFFGRYGLHDKVTLIAYVPHTRVYQNKQVFSSGRDPIPGQEFSSLGDINFGAEMQLRNNSNWVLSTSLILGLPTGTSDGGSDGSYQTGDGEFNQLFRLHVGRSYRLGKKQFYAKAHIGVNQRSKGFSDELRAGAETGTKIFNQKLLVLCRINIIESFQNGYLDATNSNGSIFANNVEVINVGGELIYNLFKAWSISLTAAFPARGRLIYRAPAVSTGISLQL